MGIQNTFTIHTNSVEQSNALKAFVKALKMEYVVAKDELNIPEEHKQIVRDRIATSTKENYISWEEGRKSLKFKK